jgi:hypothetical protein
MWQVVFRYRILILTIVLGANFTDDVKGAADPDRESLIRQLSNLLLGSEQPLQIDDNRGWRGVLLAPPGTPVTPIITAFDGLSGGTQSVVQLLDSIQLFDKALTVEDGLAAAGERSIGTVWEDLVERCMPTSERFLRTARSETDESKWLFKKTDRIDDARGIKFEREPSRYLNRYREFESMYQVLANAEVTGDGAWRMHPKLETFPSVRDAKDTILRDWVRYGFKTEIEAADLTFRKSEGQKQWSDWTNVRQRFQSERLYIDAKQWVPRTYLFPPASEWMSMSSWSSLKVVTTGGKLVKFQLARIRIHRPWLALDDLLDGKLVVNSVNAKKDNYTLSSGDVPTLTKYPRGRMAVFADELLLVRQLRFEDAEAAQVHPLGRFTYPDAINLAGYVVRVLPRLPAHPN